MLAAILLFLALLFVVDVILYRRTMRKLRDIARLERERAERIESDVRFWERVREQVCSGEITFWPKQSA